MPEYSVTVKPQNKNAVCLFCGVTLLAAVVFFVSTKMEVYRGILQFLALLLLTTAVLLYTQYVSALFLYDVMRGEDDAPIFTVRRLIGKRATTLCRFSLYDVTKIEKTVPADRAKKKREKGRARYVFAATLFADTLYRIRIDGAECADVFLELTPEAEQNLLPILEQFKRRAP